MIKPLILVMTILLSASAADHAVIVRLANLVEKKTGTSWERLRFGAQIGTGDQIRTGKHSKVMFDMGNSCFVIAHENSLLSFAELAAWQKTLNATAGTFELRIGTSDTLRSMTISTPAARAEVADSTVMALMVGRTSRFYLYTGKITVIAPGKKPPAPVTLAPNHYLRVRKNPSKLRPEKIPAKMARDMVQTMQRERNPALGGY
ncbi:MAG: hypothetical protein MUF22_02990 [Chitinispirillaceae bacterium]|jgi:hypothetical protein|nr:hypothetical protein [Chitinispirillaceae bacterium]